MKRKIALLIILLILFLIGIRAQVPYGLNSLPSARPTIFLDFDGQVVDDPYWRPFSGDSIIKCLPSNLSNASMVKVFNHVAEDFRPFNINITTDSAVYLAAPITRRTRVIITPTWRWYGASGGVAYVESFRWGLNTPCFVFDTLLAYSDKRVAEAASHEAGHTLGLYHQAQYRFENTDTCRFVTEYNPGRGSGDIAWSPIMGNSYDRNLTTWHNGRNSFGCTSLQNDLSIIASTANGVTYRLDDYGNTINTSTNVTITNGNYLISGIINDSTDMDFFGFQFNTPGRFILKATPFKTGPPNIASGLLNGVVNYNGNVDLEVTLFRNNIEIGKYNPTNLLSVSIDTLLDPGNYTIRINGIANVNVFKNVLLGSYILEGSFGGSVVVPIRSIEIVGRIIKDLHRINWQIITDEEVDKIWIEVSSNGYEFRKLQYVTGLDGLFEYKPNDNDAHYKIGAITKLGVITYSNTIYIKPITISKYKLLSNVVYNNQIIVNSKNLYEWRLFDLSGKKISNGRFINGQNSLKIPYIKGLYFLQILTDNKIYVEKIIKL